MGLRAPIRSLGCPFKGMGIVIPSDFRRLEVGSPRPTSQFSLSLLEWVPLGWKAELGCEMRVW